MITRRMWMAEQDEIIRNLWGKVTASTIALQTGTNKKQVLRRAMALGLHRLKDAPGQGGQVNVLSRTCDSNKMFLEAYTAWAAKHNMRVHTYNRREHD